MSVPRHSYDPRRVCLIQLPKVSLGPRKREAGVYISGALFAIGWWLFADACMLSSRAKLPPDAPYDTLVHVRGTDWIPGLFSTLGMIIVNLIDKQRLTGDDDGGSFGGFGGGVAWKARLFLFVGFAFMAGGLAGSVAVLVLKYVIPDYEQDVVYWGVCNVLQSVCIMTSACVLWIAQNSDQDYEYNLAI